VCVCRFDICHIIRRQTRSVILGEPFCMFYNNQQIFQSNALLWYPVQGIRTIGCNIRNSRSILIWRSP
jgi:hypothetical protein